MIYINERSIGKGLELFESFGQNSLTSVDLETRAIAAANVAIISEWAIQGRQGELPENIPEIDETAVMILRLKAGGRK